MRENWKISPRCCLLTYTALSVFIAATTAQKSALNVFNSCYREHNGEEKQAKLQGLYAINNNNNNKSCMVLVAPKKTWCRNWHKPARERNIKVQLNILGTAGFSFLLRLAAAAAFLFVKKHKIKTRERKKKKWNEA